MTLTQHHTTLQPVCVWCEVLVRAFSIFLQQQVVLVWKRNQDITNDIRQCSFVLWRCMSLSQRHMANVHCSNITPHIDIDVCHTFSHQTPQRLETFYRRVRAPKTATVTPIWVVRFSDFHQIFIRFSSDVHQTFAFLLQGVSSATHGTLLRYFQYIPHSAQRNFSTI